MAKTKLSSLFQDLRGKVQGGVVVKTANGLVMRGRPRYKYPKLPNVMLGANRFAEANAIWSEFTAQQAKDWQAYADTIHKVATITQQRYRPRAHNIFLALATKFMQVNPDADVPVVPPDSDFVADSIVLDVAPLPGEGVRFTASGPNSNGVLTEILMQVLPNARRAPKPFYKGATFVHFIPEDLHADLDLPPGYYAFAYRFVRGATGQVSPMELLGTVEVS